MKPGPMNLITDIDGLTVGNAEDEKALTGVTVLIADKPAIAAVDIRGGGPATRGTASLGLSRLVDRVDALVFSGGSEYGLDAAGAVVTALAAQGRGFLYGGMRVPIVPGACLFDLINGGDKDWGTTPPYPDLARKAVRDTGRAIRLGNAGAGYGAHAATLKGGLGSASVIDPVTGHTVGALVAANPRGSAVVPGTDRLWAAPFALDGELGNQPEPARAIDLSADLETGPSEGGNTVLAVVATDAGLTQPQAERMAIMAQDGLARALRPTHTPFDGDLVFALSTEKKPLAGDADRTVARLGAIAADTLARAIARAVFEADDLGIYQSYRTVHGAR